MSSHEVIYPRDICLVVFCYRRSVFTFNSIRKCVVSGSARSVSIYHIAGLFNRENVILILYLVHLVGNGDPDVVRGRCCQCSGEVFLSKRKGSLDIQLVMMVTAYENLIAFFVNQHHPIIFFRGLTRNMSANDDTDRIICAVFTFEDILFRGRGHIRDVAHPGIILRKCDKRIVFARPLEIESLFRVIGSYRTKGIRVIGYKTRHLYPPVDRIVDGNLRMVADHLYHISLVGHLSIDLTIVIRIAGKTCPIDHTPRRTLQQSHNLGLRFVTKFILLEFRHILIGEKMYGSGIFRHFGLEISC